MLPLPATASDQGTACRGKSRWVGAVADAYFAERLAQEQLQLSEHTLSDWNQSLDLAQRLKAARQSSALDVAHAEGQVAMKPMRRPAGVGTGSSVAAFDRRGDLGDPLRHRCHCKPSL